MALALNGGVSLAVWMGGCAVELDSARRADLGPEALAYAGFDPGGDVGGAVTRTVYSAICAAFDRSLVLDILSGASAGGVNGALLGAAMTAERRLHPRFVRQSWIQLGDFSNLLHKTSEEAPRSLMQGELFHESMVRAFRAVLDEDGDGDGPAPEESDVAAGALPASQEGKPGREDRGAPAPKLDVTMTDVVGTELSFHDVWDGDLVAREYRARFKFRQVDDYKAPALAAAARTSASFPVAFEPWLVKDGAAELAGLAKGETTYGVDGGLLDNAPIRAALDLIPGQSASNEVRRFVCYLNADPPLPAPGKADEDDEEPTLKDVLGYVVNLPRVAPFVDQLYAVREASRRADLAPLVQDPLLELPLPTLTATAEALLPAYRRRRTVESLDELLEEPAAPARALRRLESVGEGLPWVPTSLRPPAEPEGWEWGVRPAQRILHLLLDLLRRELDATSDAAAREAALDVRVAIDAQLGELERIRGELTAEPGVRAELERLAAGEGDAEGIADGVRDLTAELRGEAYGCVLAAIAAFEEERLPASFLSRALAIEVVRRAFAAEAEIETAQPLRFVQLTPAAPTPILARDPFEPAKPAKARDKLTGVDLGHFAGFYRRSWRANDFMWGRLDGAARIVEMLLDGVRADDADAAAATLAAAVLPEDGDGAAAWLVHEALEAKLGAGYPLRGPEVPPAGELTPLLRAAIAAELREAQEPADDDGPLKATTDRLPLTWAVCARAVQLEVLRDELPELNRESAGDRDLGASSPALELPLESGVGAAIEDMRAGKPLPRRLNDDREEVSDLGLRTISHAALVGLSAVKAAGAPLAKAFGTVRVPLQTIGGVVSRHLVYRATVALAFWAAALYLTMRFATAKQDQAPPLTDLWSLPVLLSLVATLAVLAVVLVPGLRGWREVNRAANWAFAAGLLAFGGVAAALLAHFGGHRDFAAVLFGAGAEQLPDRLVGTALAVTAGLGAVRLPIFGKTVNTWLADKSGVIGLCGLIAVSGLVAGFSIPRVTPLLCDSWWQVGSAVLALAAAPILAAVYLLPRRSPP